MNIISAYVIGFIGQWAVIASCYRLDKYVPKEKYFARSGVYERTKPFFVFTKKAGRNDFITLTILFQSLAYFFMLGSTVLFAIAMIQKHPGLIFASTLVSYILMGLATAENLFEVIVLETLDIRGEHLD